VADIFGTGNKLQTFK